jgi:hypothetical protein
MCVVSHEGHLAQMLISAVVSVLNNCAKHPLFTVRYRGTSKGSTVQCSNLSFLTTNFTIVGSIPDEIIGFFFLNLSNPSSPTMALGFTHPLREMSTMNHLGEGSKAQPARKTGILTAICKPTL